MDPATAKIGLLWQRLFTEKMQSKILHRKDPGKLFVAYTNYEIDEHGKYTYLLGEEVTSFENQLEEFNTLIIPAQKYIKFTSDPGKIPGIVIDLWQKIWKMPASDLGGQRAYIADLEIYDQRSQDPNNTVFDIYISIK